VTIIFIISPISEALFSDALSLAGLQEHLINIAVRDITGSIGLFQTGNASTPMEAFHQFLA